MNVIECIVIDKGTCRQEQAYKDEGVVLSSLFCQYCFAMYLTRILESAMPIINHLTAPVFIFTFVSL